MPGLKIGRSVHYAAPATSDGDMTTCRAALITEVVSDTIRGENEYGVTTEPAVVHLAVFNPTGMDFKTDVPYQGSAEDNDTWHLPEHARCGA